METTRTWTGNRVTAFGVVTIVVAGTAYVETMQYLRSEPDLLGQRAIGLAIAAFGLVGALLIDRRPDHRLGWLLAGTSTLALVGGSANEFVLAGARTGDTATAFWEWLVWISNWFWHPVLGAVLVFLPLLFPDGRAPGRRWWWVVFLGGVATTGLVIASALQRRYEETILGPIPSTDNPIGVEGWSSSLDAVFEVSLLALLAAFVGAASAMTVRYHQSRGVERLQLKWFTFAVGLLLVWLLLGEFLWELLGRPDLFGGSVLPFGVLLTFVPVAVAVAILRYRLYAIDRIVSRTVSYGLVAGLLALVYVSSVFVVQSLLPGEQSELAVAASTLVAAGLFNPLRHRTQQAVDRRFNRNHFNSERVIAEFATGLREQVDLGELASNLRLVLGGTVEPVTIGIWLRSRP